MVYSFWFFLPPTLTFSIVPFFPPSPLPNSCIKFLPPLSPTKESVPITDPCSYMSLEFNPITYQKQFLFFGFWSASGMFHPNLILPHRVYVNPPSPPPPFLYYLEGDPCPLRTSKSPMSFHWKLPPLPPSPAHQFSPLYFWSIRTLCLPTVSTPSSLVPTLI